MEECRQCEYTYSEEPRAGLTDRLRREAYAVAEALQDVETLRERPADEVWSALEYGCHVRDVLEVQNSRVRLAQREDAPAFEPMNREERVTSLAYNDQDPTEVADAILANAATLAATLDSLDIHGWDRTGIYNWPERAERTVEWIARHTIHELVHHSQDIAAVGSGRVP